MEEKTKNILKETSQEFIVISDDVASEISTKAVKFIEEISVESIFAQKGSYFTVYFLIFYYFCSII